MDLEEMKVEWLKDGYSFDPSAEQYRCLCCGKTFEVGEIYTLEGRFWEARQAVTRHVSQEHGDRLDSLLGTDSKYITLTENQRELMCMFRSGLSDTEIAAQTHTAPATVRHQRFAFREKAKQAVMYLALYELAVDKKRNGPSALTPIREGAKMVDERYITIQEESEKILRNAFESLSPLKLKTFSPKEKKKIVILTRIVEEFEQGKMYTEKEVNEILRPIYEDYVTLRRYLIEYGFMERSRDCGQYWVK